MSKVSLSLSIDSSITEVILHAALRQISVVDVLGLSNINIVACY